MLLTLLITMKVFQFILFMTDAAILDLTMDMKDKVIYGLVSLGASFAFAAIAINIFQLGMAGLVLGFLLGQGILMVSYPMIVLRTIRERYFKNWVYIARPAATCAVVFAISLFLGNTVVVRDWFSLIVMCATTFVVALASAFYFGLPKTMREQILKRIPF